MKAILLMQPLTKFHTPLTYKKEKEVFHFSSTLEGLSDAADLMHTIEQLFWNFWHSFLLLTVERLNLQSHVFLLLLQL